MDEKTTWHGGRWSSSEARVLALLNNRKDRHLLTSWLSRAYSVEAPDPVGQSLSRVLFERSYDVLVLDGPTLETQRSILRLVRKSPDEVFMPILLVTTRKGVRHATENLWQLIDEVILAPIEKSELYARVEILLRARYYSQRLQERYYGLAQIAPIGILVIGRDGIIQYANSHAERIFVGRELSLVGRSVEEPWEVFYPSGGRMPREDWPFFQIMTTGVGIRDQQIAYRDPHGFEYRLSFAGVPIGPGDGSVESVLLVASDVTHQVRQADELRHARDRAEEMSRLKSSFLANMSHEIRTPLTGILSGSEILFAEGHDEMKEVAKLITVSAERLRRTLDTVLELAEMESESRVIKGVSNLSTVIRRVVHDFGRLAEGRGIDLNIRVPEKCELHFEEAAVERVVESLISNAVKFSRDGRVEITLWCSESTAILEVTDEGVGIGEDFLPYVFDEFKQESEGMTREFEGIGLGLTVARRLVRMMEGQIEVESTKGIGSTFRVILPTSQSKREGDAAPDEASDDAEVRDEQIPLATRETFFKIFDLHPFPCFILDAETQKIIQANAAVRFYGYTSEDILGRYASDICTLDDGLSAPEDQLGWGRWNIRTRDGTYRPVLAISTNFRSAGHRYTVVHLVDDEPVPERSFVQADRLRQLQVLQSFSTRIAVADDLGALYRTIDSVMREAFGNVDLFGLWTFDPRTDRLELAVASGPRDEEELAVLAELPEFRALLKLDDIQTENAWEGSLSAPFAGSRTFADAQSLAIVPMRVGAEPVAVLVLAGLSAREQANPIEQRMMRAFATLSAMVIQRLRLTNRLREASRLLVTAQESERRAISQDLHDEIGGLLNSLGLIVKRATSTDDSVVEELQEAIRIVDELIGHVRDLSFELSPQMLPDLGLVYTIQSYAKRYSARTQIDTDLNLEIDREARYPSEIESTAYRVVQESLTNASKHAGVDEVQVHLREHDGRLIIHVIDYGKGFLPEDKSSHSGGMGLRGLEERVDLIGGELEIAAAPGEGTRISAFLPLEI